MVKSQTGITGGRGWICGVLTTKPTKKAATVIPAAMKYFGVIIYFWLIICNLEIGWGCANMMANRYNYLIGNMKVIKFLFARLDEWQLQSEGGSSPDLPQKIACLKVILEKVERPTGNVRSSNDVSDQLDKPSPSLLSQ